MRPVVTGQASYRKTGQPPASLRPLPPRSGEGLRKVAVLLVEYALNGLDVGLEGQHLRGGRGGKGVAGLERGLPEFGGGGYDRQRLGVDDNEDIVGQKGLGGLA